MNYKFKYRLFGRSKGRSKKNELIDEAVKIKFKKIDQTKFNIIDVGCGYGESTLEISKFDSDKTVIACEKYIDGLNNIAKNIKNIEVNNVSLFQGNVHQLLDENCPDNSISEIWILFPDPSPKKRHYKRRLINYNFFLKIKKYLKKNSIIHIATDSKEYISDILFNAYKIKNDFEWLNQSKIEWNYVNLPLPDTKYFQKALKKGLNPFYLKLKKL